jgi:uncharacterized protein DUF4349
MKILPFPKPGDSDEEALTAQIEAALHGESGGEAADYWRELRADVRSLAPPISPEFERRLRERIEQRALSPRQGARKRASVRSAFVRAQAWLGSGRRARVLAPAGVCVVVAVVTLVLIAPWQGSNVQFTPAMLKADQMRPSVAEPGLARADSSAAAGSTSASAPVRVQQRAATITLAATPAAVQSLADRVARLAVDDGGFVQSSQVRLQHGSDGEANLQLSLPSTRLSAALAALAQLAPTRAESQSLQDISGEYDAARTKLADAVAERQALLQALSRASTQGEIESLHVRLSLAAAAITRTRGEYQAVSRRGSNAAIEVTVRGDAHAGGDRSVLGNGLHDAGAVLKVALAAAIVALAVLVPLALLLALLALGWRATKRRLRERALS